MKKLGVVALILALCIALSSCANFGGEASGTEIDSTATDGVSDSENVTETDSESETDGGSGAAKEESTDAGEKAEKINFFMINDNHGSFVGDSDSVGVEKLANVLSKAEHANGEYIKIANGDILQGTYVSSSMRGLPMIEALNEMEFDCFVIGNHEFDWGIEEIAKYADGNIDNGEANFPFLGANIYDKKTGKRPEWLRPYTIVEYGGRKVGIIGVIGERLEGSILTSKVANYEFVEYTDMVRDYAAELRSLGCEVVVLSVHDYDEQANEIMAKFSGSSRIDAIFCGHTHQKINEKLARYDGYVIPVVENYGNGDLATSVTLTLANNMSATAQVHQYQVRNFDKDADMGANVISKYAQMIEDSYRVVEKTSAYLSRQAMGEICCNSMTEILGAHVSMVNTGGVRSDIQPGDITAGEIFASFPFENTVVIVTMTGARLKLLYDKNAEYLYFNSDFVASNIDSDKTYSVAVVDYVYEHRSYVELFAGLEYEYTNHILRDLVIDYVEDTLSVSLVLPCYFAV